MREHIDDLGSREITINGQAATARYLDIRVQPGGLDEAHHLIEYGADNNVVVLIREFPS
jgi:hypothetical protein